MLRMFDAPTQRFTLDFKSFPDTFVEIEGFTHAAIADRRSQAREGVAQVGTRGALRPIGPEQSGQDLAVRSCAPPLRLAQ